MADSIRQQIISLVYDRFKSVQKSNGYETDLGLHAYLWRDLARQPFAETELPGCTIRDFNEEHQPTISGRADHHHTLFVELHIASGVTISGASIDGDQQVRKLIADCHKAIGATTNGRAGIKWANAGGVELAFNTLPVQNEIGVEQEGRTLGAIFFRFKIEYRTQRWNPYAQ